MKKILSIVLGLVLVLSLSLVTATSVGADVHDISVTPDPDTVDTVANYTIVFNTTQTLGIDATISVKFPDGTTVPTTGWATGDVTVQGWDISYGDISVSGQEVTIWLPEGIGAEAEVTVVFTDDFGITNPVDDDDEYTLDVKTSKETNWVPSDEYTIRKSDYSTYEFAFEVPEKIWLDEAAEVDVTLQTDVEGQNGYPYAQIRFGADGPIDSTVTFNVSYDGGWYPTFDSGTWPPASGNFSVDEDDEYEENIPFKLTFDTVGLYTIEFELWDVDANEVLEEDEIIFAVTGISINVTLDKGWNLMSLPIVPDDEDIEDVLADIMGDVISVHYYRATTGTWLVYVPGEYYPNPLNTMEDGNAYWINMSAAANLTVVGQEMAAPGMEGGAPPTYPVVEGWNMVGFKSMEEDMTAEEYLEGTAFVKIYGFDFDEGGWFSVGDTDMMKPGLGYWVAFSEEGTIYP